MQKCLKDPVVRSEGGPGKYPVIGFVGAGKVGKALGIFFRRKGVPVSGYFSRSRDSAKRAAAQIVAAYYEELSDVANASDVLFLTVPDGQIASVWKRLCALQEAGTVSLSGKWVIHCSGSLSTDILSNADAFGARTASLHPILAVADPVKAAEEFSEAVFTLQSEDGLRQQAIDFFRGLGLNVLPLAADRKVTYHAACVMASNLVCGLYAAAAELLVSCGFEPETANGALAPLFLGNAANVAAAGPRAALTGPVERGDWETVEKHVSALEAAGLETDLAVYKALTERVKELKERGA